MLHFQHLKQSIPEVKFFQGLILLHNILNLKVFLTEGIYLIKLLLSIKDHAKYPIIGS